MEKQKIPFGMALGGIMRELVRLIKKRTSEQVDIKLTMEQIGLLIAISCKEEEVIQQDMASLMGKDKSAILRTIDMIEAKDLIKRVSDTTDRRKKYLMITKKGERVIDQYLDIMHGITTEMQEGLSQEDMDTFYKVVDHMKTNAEAI